MRGVLHESVTTISSTPVEHTRVHLPHAIQLVCLRINSVVSDVSEMSKAPEGHILTQKPHRLHSPDGLIRGNVITYDIPKGTRTRLVEYGVLRKFGSKFELTDKGLNLLQTV